MVAMRNIVYEGSENASAQHGQARFKYHKVGAAEVRLGKGQMIMLPLRVQHRAQPYGTFKLLFNAVLISAALE
jgi:hypothetical protein